MGTFSNGNYDKSEWYDNITLVDAKKLNNMENGIHLAYQLLKALSIDKSDVGHNHDKNYYSKKEVNDIVKSLDVDLSDYATLLDLSLKADVDHDHDKDYSKLGHTHNTNEIFHNEVKLSETLEEMKKIITRGCPRQFYSYYESRR